MSEHNKVIIGQPNNTPQGECDLSITLRGETHHLKIPFGNSILDSLLSQKITPPFSCMTGSCCACMATITEGQVYQSVQGGLPNFDRDKNNTLTCQARPLTQKVSITY